MPLAHPLNAFNLKVVVLESAYDSLHDEQTRDTFSKIMAFKLRGYKDAYDYGVLPVDTADFICTHLAVFQGEGGNSRPVMAYKSVKERKCRTHHIPFSALQVVTTSDAQENVRAIKKIIEDSEINNSLVAYDGAWTIDPETRKNRALVVELKNLFTAIQVHHYLPFGRIDLLCCGQLRFKTDILFKSWGYAPLKLDGRELPHFRQASLFGEPALMLHAQNFSKSALEIAEQYRSFWDDRLILGNIKLSPKQNDDRQAA